MMASEIKDYGNFIIALALIVLAIVIFLMGAAIIGKANDFYLLALQGLELCG